MNDFEESKTEKYPEMKRDFAILTDDSLMTYGQHKGKKMKDIPAKDLLWLADNNRCNKSVRQYITDNWDVLCKQAGRTPQGVVHADVPRRFTRRV